MKIVFVLENYIPHIGGVEMLFKNLCERLAIKNDVHVITHRVPGSKLEEELTGVHVHRIKVPRLFPRYFFTLLCIPTVIRIGKDADILHTTTYNGAPPARWASMILKKPCVITIHEVIGKNWSGLLEMPYLSGKLHEFLEWLVISLKFQRYICVSNSTKKDFLEVKHGRNSVVIYNGIDYDFFSPEKYNGKEIRKNLGLEGRFVYLFYGRPGPSKGFEHLLAAVPKIRAKLKDSKLLAILSRDRSYDARYEKMMRIIEELGIKDDVVIVPPQPFKKLPNYLKAADCVVVPSLTEGFGYAVGEACAMGKPVVASNTKSIPEVISGDYELVKTKDPADIARGVIDVFSMKMKRTQLKKFTWEKCVEQYMDTYRQVLKEWKHG